MLEVDGAVGDADPWCVDDEGLLSVLPVWEGKVLGMLLNQQQGFTCNALVCSRANSTD